MTVSTIDYRSDSAAAPAPVATGALSAVLALALALQCVAGGLAVYPAVDFLPWKLGVSILTALGAVGLPTLAAIGFVALRRNAPGADRAMGRFFRFSAYGFVLSFLTSIGLEGKYLGSGGGVYLLTALRAGCEAGLTFATFVSLQRSQTVLRTCGRNFSARVADAMLRMIATDGAAAILLMLASLVLVLAWNAIPSVKTFGWHFLTSTDWRDVQYNDDGDVTLPPAFGALTAIYGTVVTSAIALACAAPVSIGAALFLARIVPRVPAGWRWLLSIASFLIEFLAAIPSIAYGIWGMFILAPFLAKFIEPPINRLFGAVPGLRWLHMQQPPTGCDLFCAGIVLAIMILPIITAVSRDVLVSVPRTQIEGTLALGATWWQSCWGMLRYAKSGLFGAVMLGLARAAGETMAVAMVLFDSHEIHGSWFAPGRTMASVLANEFGEADSPIYRGSLVEVALILLLMSLVFNIVARSLVVGRAGVRAV